MLTELEAKKYRWKAYIERLYNAKNKPVSLELESESLLDRDALGPRIITSKIEEAMRKFGKEKAEVCDGIPAEFLQALRGETLN